jgi:hypothetical protein
MWMGVMGLVVMSKRELGRLEIVARLTRGQIGIDHAAGLMGISRRQVFRLKSRYELLGAPGLASQKRGQPSNNRICEAVRTEALRLIELHYRDFGPTLAAEKLAERHQIALSRETLRAWMNQAGLWATRSQRKARLHQPRYRRQHLGELIQIDGSEHDWFEGRGPKCSLLVFIDDATGRLMQLMFAVSESAFAYFDALRGYLEQHGRPIAFYSDKHSIFRVTGADKRAGDGLTQFGRALQSLNIEIICANSSQAKGRVERANKTLQDRLVKEMRLAGINDMTAANAFVPQFIAIWNARFAKPAANPNDLHRCLRDSDSLDLLLCWRSKRRMTANLVVHYNRMQLVIEDCELARHAAGQDIEVLDFPDGRLEVHWRNIPLPYRAIDKLQRVDPAAIVDNKRLSEALSYIQAEQARREPLKPDRIGPQRSHQKTGIMKARTDKFAQMKKRA